MKRVPLKNVIYFYKQYRDIGEVNNLRLSVLVTLLFIISFCTLIFSSSILLLLYSVLIYYSNNDFNKRILL